MAPRIPLDPALVDDYGVGNPKGLVPSLTALRADAQHAVEGLVGIDPVLQELCRLRNAKHQQCQLCMRLRYTDADEELLGAVDDYETSERLTTRQRLALSLADLYMRSPSEPSAARRGALLEEFTPAELVEIVVRQFWFASNKTMVALGLDGRAEFTPSGR